MASLNRNLSAMKEILRGGGNITQIGRDGSSAMTVIVSSSLLAPLVLSLITEGEAIICTRILEAYEPKEDTTVTSPTLNDICDEVRPPEPEELR